MTESQNQGSDAPPAQSDSEKLHQMTMAELSELIYWSFYYSQGKPRLQTEMIAIAATLSPHICMPKNMSDDAFVLSQLPRYTRFFEKGSHRSLFTTREGALKAIEEKALKGKIEDVEKIGMQDVKEIDACAERLKVTWYEGFVAWSFFKELEKFHEHFDKPRKESQTMKDFAQDALRQMIWNDYDNLVVESGEGVTKPKPRPAEEKRPSSGPFRANLSHFFEYVVNGVHAAGPDIFEKIMVKFRELASTKEFAQYLVLSSTMPQLQALIEHYGFSLEKYSHLKSRLITWQIARKKPPISE